MEKEKLIKAINSKGLHNSLISIYYNFLMVEYLNGINHNLRRSILLSRVVKMGNMELHMAFIIAMEKEKIVMMTMSI